MDWDDEYTKSVDEFLAEADWIGAIERPLAVQLRALAASLDASMRTEHTVQSAAASQFAQTWARLAKRGPAAPAGGGDDEPEGLFGPIPGLEAGLAHGVGCMCPSCAA